MRANKLLGLSEELLDFQDLRGDAVVNAFNKKLQEFEFDDVVCDDAFVDEDVILVDFSDTDGNSITAAFFIDYEDNTPSVFVIDDEDNDGVLDDNEDYYLIDMSSLTPPVKRNHHGKIIMLDNLDWMNKSTLATILSVGFFSEEQEEEEEETPILQGSTYDAFGNWYNFRMPHNLQLESNTAVFADLEDVPENQDIDELFKTVVRGGKKLKLPIVRRIKRKRRLTPAQKRGIRKAVMARKRTQNLALKKRQKSLKVRKRLRLKSQPVKKTHRVSYADTSHHPDHGVNK